MSIETGNTTENTIEEIAEYTEEEKEEINDQLWEIFDKVDWVDAKDFWEIDISNNESCRSFLNSIEGDEELLSFFPWFYNGIILCL